VAQKCDLLPSADGVLLVAERLERGPRPPPLQKAYDRQQERKAKVSLGGAR
jgi:hypothetical protein